jgi:hypothetical protein
MRPPRSSGGLFQCGLPENGRRKAGPANLTLDCDPHPCDSTPRHPGTGLATRLSPGFEPSGKTKSGETNRTKHGNQESRVKPREDHYTPENFRMEWFGKTLLRRYRARRKIRLVVIVLWSWRRDLNPRPPDYKSGALPTELRQQLGTAAPPRKLIPLIPSRCPGQLIKLSQGESGAQPGGASVGSVRNSSNHRGAGEHRVKPESQSARRTAAENAGGSGGPGHCLRLSPHKHLRN